MGLVKSEGIYDNRYVVGNQLVHTLPSGLLDMKPTGPTEPLIQPVQQRTSHYAPSMTVIEMDKL